MTGVNLLECLRPFVREALKDLVLPVQDGSCRVPDIYLMRLPNLPEDVPPVPYVILQLVTGADTQEPGEPPRASAFVRAIAACYSEDCQDGSLQVLNVLTRLRVALLKARVIDGQFVLTPPLELIVYPDGKPPYFHGEMALNFDLPGIGQDVIF